MYITMPDIIIIQAKKVFMVKGGYKTVCKSLRDRGWVEAEYYIKKTSSKTCGMDRFNSDGNTSDDQDDEVEESESDDEHDDEEEYIMLVITFSTMHIYCTYMYMYMYVVTCSKHALYVHVCHNVQCVPLLQYNVHVLYVYMNVQLLHISAV